MKPGRETDAYMHHYDFLSFLLGEVRHQRYAMFSGDVVLEALDARLARGRQQVLETELEQSPSRARSSSRPRPSRESARVGAGRRRNALMAGAGSGRESAERIAQDRSSSVA